MGILRHQPHFRRQSSHLQCAATQGSREGQSNVCAKASGLLCADDASSYYGHFYRTLSTITQPTAHILDIYYLVDTLQSTRQLLALWITSLLSLASNLSPLIHLYLNHIGALK